MSQYDILVKALEEQRLLSQAQSGHDDTLTRFRPAEQKWEDVNTQRFNRGLMGFGESIYDAIRRPKARREYNQGLNEVLQSARGVDEIKAQIEMMAQVRAAEEQRAYEEQKAARDQGYKSALQSQKDAAAMERAKVPRSGTTVNVNGSEGPQVGTIPPGMELFKDPQTGAYRMQPIPGSEQDMERKQAAQMAETKDANARNKYAGILDEVNQAFANVNNLTAGFIGGNTGGVKGTDAYTLARQLDTIKGNLGFDRLQQMREESKTGGALGQVSNIELGLLTSSLTSLDAGLKPDQLRRNLAKVQKHYQNFLDALSGKMPGGYDEKGNPATQDDDPLGLFQ